jgi:NAD(P)H-flavin reductase
MMSNNPYQPIKAKVAAITQETSADIDIKTFRVAFDAPGFSFLPGQFVELSLPGAGEAPFGFASSPLEKGFIELSIKRAGVVTNAAHNLRVGDPVYIRGPFGNHFDYDALTGRNLLFVAGGLGLAPLRPLFEYCIAEENRAKYPSVELLSAARSPADFLYTYDLDRWRKTAKVTRTIDRAVAGWEELVGFPHNLIADFNIDAANTVALLCGPPVMIKAVAAKLRERGVPPERIVTTLEMRMTCGIGKCGKCNIGHLYVCVDGPVFTLAELDKLPNEY